MSSSEDEEHGRIAFNHEADYEGGEWIGGEFYARGERKGRTMSKDEALYGYDSSDDEYGGGRRRKGKKGQGRDPTLGKPVNFVTGTKTQAFQPSAADKAAASRRKKSGGGRGDDWLGGRKGGLGFQGGSSDEGEGMEEGDEEEEEEEEGFRGPRRKRKGGPGGDLDDDEEDDEEDGMGRPGLGSGGRRGLGLEDDDMEVDEEGGGAASRAEKPVDTKDKFKQVLKAGGVGNLAAPPSKDQEFFRNLIKEKEDEAKAKEEEAAKAKRRLAPVKFDAKKGFDWDKKGFASKYLAKFGFKGRLGKEEQGITKVPDVVVRPDRLGLGLMKEATQLKTNRQIEADLHGKEMTHDEEEEAGRRRKKKEGEGKMLSLAEQMAEEMGWKKGKEGQKKGGKAHKHLTVEDILSMEKAADFVHEGEAPSTGAKQVIKDLRGPQEKLLTNLDEINYEVSEGVAGVDEELKLGQELLHNVTVVLDMCESVLYGLDKSIKTEQSHISKLEKRLGELEVLVEEGEGKLQRMNSVSEILTRVQQRINEDASKVPMEAILKVFRTLKEHFWEEYIMFELWQLAPTLAGPVLKRLLDEWKPFEDPHRVLDLLLEWRPVLLGTRGGQEGDEEEVNPLHLKAGEEAFEHIIQTMVLPRVRTALMREWKVRQVLPCVELLKGLQHILRPEDYQGLLSVILLPKITKAVEDWNPRADVMPIHQWIHPWLPLMGSSLSVVFPDIRRKLSKVLVDWHPSDASAHVILKPWVGVFDNKSMESLLVKCIIPKLVGALQELAIVPHSQDLSRFNWTMLWRDIIPPMHFFALLEGEFFPKWIQVLYAWLTSPAADYNEIADWFVGWKEQFPPEVMADPRISSQFQHALQLMNDAMTAAASAPPGHPPMVPPLHIPHLSYLMALEQRKIEALQSQDVGYRQQLVATAQAAPPPPPSAHPAMHLSFRELVEMRATELGLSFVPKPGRMYNGRQVWSLGGKSVYLDQDVAFVDVGGHQWTPMALEELFAFCAAG